MLYNKVNIAIAAVLILILYFTIPLNNKWLYNKIIDGGALAKQLKEPGMDTRRERRFGYSYTVYKKLEERVKNKEAVLILLPPQEQVKKVGESSLVIPEPAVLYYHTGLRSVWANSTDARSANSEVQVNGSGRVAINRIHGQVYLDSLLTAYQAMLK